MSDDRHSQADSVELITDPTEKAQREAENGVRQFRAALEIIASNIMLPNSAFRLKQATILTLNQKALQGIHPLAGTYRNSHVSIGQSSHVPPPHIDVPDYVTEMCGYVKDNWDNKGAIHLAAYVLWRMNWIHPFADGNGRTARVVSYLVLSIKLKSFLPGFPTIPDQIAADKKPYYHALEMADGLWKQEILSLATMEEMLERMLAIQLLNATEEASG
jgi:Fic family protein